MDAWRRTSADTLWWVTSLRRHTAKPAIPKAPRMSSSAARAEHADAKSTVGNCRPMCAGSAAEAAGAAAETGRSSFRPFCWFELTGSASGQVDVDDVFQGLGQPCKGGLVRHEFCRCHGHGARRPRLAAQRWEGRAHPKTWPAPVELCRLTPCAPRAACLSNRLAPARCRPPCVYMFAWGALLAAGGTRPGRRAGRVATTIPVKLCRKSWVCPQASPNAPWPERRPAPCRISTQWHDRTEAPVPVRAACRAAWSESLGLCSYTCSVEDPRGFSSGPQPQPAHRPMHLPAPAWGPHPARHPREQEGESTRERGQKARAGSAGRVARRPVGFTCQACCSVCASRLRTPPQLCAGCRGARASKTCWRRCNERLGGPSAASAWWTCAQASA